MNGPHLLQPLLIQVRNKSRVRTGPAWLFQTVIPAVKSDRRAHAIAAAVGRLMRLATQAAHVLIGIPDYKTYVQHRQTLCRGEPIMSYRDFFRDREEARYALDKGRGFSGIG